MKTAAEIQQLIFEQTGIKTSVKKLTGSSKDYLCFSPMLQSGKYPEFDFTWRQEYKNTFKETEPPQIFVNGTQIQIHKSLLSDTEPIKYKKERKSKTIEEMSVKTWGSKNSQLRLDKATQRNAKRLRAGTTARYY